ncbi:hypothetical protein U1Q18_011995 [Sarracenia purpurea var. burkii]
MSHGRVLSRGNVPFLWEDFPGVPKTTSPLPEHLTAAFKPRPLALHPNKNKSNSPKILQDLDIKIPPPPPCPVLDLQAPNRSSSVRFIGQQKDPFLAAMKECTRSVGNGNKAVGEAKNCAADRSKKARKSKLIIFSCKRSCKVKENNLVKFANPSLVPKERSYGGLVKMTEE